MKYKYLATASILMLLTLTMNKIYAATIQPGTVEDPLVSQSYVDDRVEQILHLISENFKEKGTTDSENSSSQETVNKITKAEKEEIISEIMKELQLLNEEGMKYVPVSASKGQIITGFEGTEIILRSGTASAVCPGQNGIVNVTDGKELLNGNRITINNLLIIPRHDGRGAKAITDAWFIIKGEYEIK